MRRRSADRSATINPTGCVFTRAPKTTVSVGADYEIPLGDNGSSIEFGVQYRYLSRQYYNPTLEFDHTLEQAGYGIVDARAACARPGIAGATWCSGSSC